MQLCFKHLPQLFCGRLFADKPSRKRKKEDLGAVLISKEEMWAQFQKCWQEISSSSSRPSRLPKDHFGSSSSVLCPAHPISPDRSLSACPPSPYWASSAACLACPSAPASPDPSSCLPSPARQSSSWPC